MTHKLKRCKHCKRTYLFQASGKGSPKYNDDTYCPECKKVVETALKEITPKYEMRFKEIKVTQEDIDNIIFLEKEYIKFLQKDEFNLIFRRVMYTDDKVITYGFFPPDFANKLAKDIKEEKFKFFIKMPTTLILINEDEKTIKVEWEYDIEKQEFGKYEWRV